MQLLDSLGSATATSSFLESLVSGVMISASLVVSESGQFAGDLGSSKSLSSPADKLWLSTLRKHSQVVLTSGKTFRAEQYRMPKTADLAVLTSTELDVSELQPQPDQSLHLLKSSSFEAAVSDLEKLGYRNIHVEFGPTGIKALLESSLHFTLFLSGPSTRSIEIAAKSLNAQPLQLCVVDGLHLAKAR